jgi:hypothetical protein
VRRVNLLPLASLALTPPSPSSQTLHLMRHGVTHMNEYLGATAHPYGSPGFRDPLLYDTRLTARGQAEAADDQKTHAAESSAPSLCCEIVLGCAAAFACKGQPRVCHVALADSPPPPCVPARPCVSTPCSTERLMVQQPCSAPASTIAAGLPERPADWRGWSTGRLTQQQQQ